MKRRQPNYLQKPKPKAIAVVDQEGRELIPVHNKDEERREVGVVAREAGEEDNFYLWIGLPEFSVLY